jgi:hypothetical protein
VVVVGDCLRVAVRVRHIVQRRKKKLIPAKLNRQLAGPLNWAEAEIPSSQKRKKSEELTPNFRSSICR